MIENTGEEHGFTNQSQKAALFQLLGSAHTLAILRVFATEPETHRFSELREQLNISPTTLSDRLEELCDADILDRRSYDQIPPRVEYEPTEKGQALRPVMESVADWLEEYEDNSS